MALSLKVYDISGKLVRTLVNSQTIQPGFYNLQWNCADQRNRKVASGVYFYRLAAITAKGTASSQPNIRTRKLVVAR